MFNFGITEFDPLDGSATSIDPLRSLAFSVRLGDMLFPGSSGRIWRLRYLSALSYLLKLSKVDPNADFKTNYIKFRKFENAFILVTYMLSDKYKETSNVSQVIGKVKSKSYIEQNNGKVGISGGDLLANQMNLGPIGIHGVLMKDEDLSLFDGENLELLPNGNDLADLYEQSLGDDHKRFSDLVSSSYRSNLKMSDLEGLTNRFMFELNGKSKKMERELLSKLIFKNSERKQFFDDVKLASSDISEEDISEFNLILSLAKLDTPNASKYQLVLAYDQFQKGLMYFFDHIRHVTKETITYNPFEDKRLTSVFNEIQKDLIEKSNDLIEKTENYKGDIEDHKDTCDLIKEFAGEVNDSLVDQESFIRYLVSFHEKHQRKKGKAAWVKFKGDMFIEVHPSNYREKPMPSYAEYVSSNMHNYRCMNVNTMLQDLNLKDVA